MIVFGQTPTNLPKLAIVVFYFERPSESDEPLELVVYLPGDSDDSPSHRSSLKPEALEKFRKGPIEAAADGDPLLTLRLDLVISPFLISQEGRIKVRMIRGDAEVRLGSLRIRTQPPPAEAGQ
jgi:hypothetical protein